MEHVLLSLVVACAIVIGVLVSRVFILAEHLAKASKDLEDLKAQPANASLELSEFLRDQSQFGFSFVRVDPAAVSVTIPRR